MMEGLGLVGISEAHGLDSLAQAGSAGIGCPHCQEDTVKLCSCVHIFALLDVTRKQ